MSTYPMSTYLCPKGHNSTEPDYCSECGARIQGSSDPSFSPTQPPSSQPKSGLTCPDCATLHEPNSGDFCEICGYNFVSGAHGEVPIAISHPPVSDPIKLEEGESHQKQETIDPVSSPLSPVLTSLDPLTWEITVEIAAVDLDPASPPPPDHFTPISLRLVQGNNLIGRTSQARAIHPEIPLDFDDAVSHRHALLSLNPDGTLTLRDIGSSNGTKLNNVELKPMVDVLLKSEDEITLGHWIKIKVASS